MNKNKSENIFFERAFYWILIITLAIFIIILLAKDKTQITRKSSTQIISYGTNSKKVLSYYPNGDIASIEEFHNDKRSGVQVSWHKNNGTLSSLAFYKDSKRDGLALRWHQNRKPIQYQWWEKGVCIDGLVPTQYTGNWKLYHDNGNLSYECQYTQGKKNGNERYWDADGNLILSNNWKMGVQLKNSSKDKTENNKKLRE